MKRLSIFIVSLLFVFTTTVYAQKLEEPLEKAFDSIRPTDVYNYCKKISSAEFAGRLTGHIGFTRAAKWAAGKFKEWGLKPIDDKNGYLQPYPSPYTVVDSARMTLLLKKDDATFEEVEMKPGEDFLPLIFTDSGDHTASVVFAGWGICAPELGYDDYAGIDVRGKFVLCFRGTPDRSEVRFEDHDQHRHRMKTAKEKGALGIIYIYPEPIANPNGDWIKGFIPAMISEKVADKLFKGRGIKAKELKEDLQKYKKPLSFPLSAEVRYQVHSRHFPEGIGYNIVGYVEGTDPKLKNECVVIGGHFDHCGEHLGLLFAGANDNGSGSSVVMAVARAFSNLPIKPKRSVVFVLFGGEEKGLEGSTYFSDHLPKPFKNVDAMFNFDMVGEGDGTSCGVAAFAPELKQIIKDADSFIHTLRRSWEIKHVGVRSSDFAPFFLKGATCAAFFSNGPHLHYHKTGDTIYRINPDIMADMARLAFLSSWKWADR